MLTLQTLKNLKQQHRDNKIIYTLLSTIIGECEQISKDPSNNEIIGIMQKMYKDNNTTLSECLNSHPEQAAVLMKENEFIEIYLPKQLTESELTALIGSQISNGMRMPEIMKYLSINYKGQYDGKLAVKIINSLL